MNIESFTIKNFKGIGEEGVTINFSPVTLFFGANNNGKSSIIQALFLAREAICNNNCNPDTVQGGGLSIKLGGFYNFVHEHDLTKSIILKFDISIDSYKDLFAKKYINKPWEFDIVTEKLKMKPDIIDFYTKYIVTNTIDSIVKLSYEIELSWDAKNSNAYISKRKTYINDNLAVVVDTLNDKSTKIINGLENDIFYSLYEPEIITQDQYDAICEKHKNELRFQKKIGNYKKIIHKNHEEFCKSLQLVVLNGYDYDAFDEGLGLISQNTSKDTYSTIYNLILLKLLNKNKTSNIIKRLNDVNKNVKKWFSIFSFYNACDQDYSNIEIDNSAMYDLVMSRKNLKTMTKLKFFHDEKNKDNYHAIMQNTSRALKLWQLLLLLIFNYFKTHHKSFDSKNVYEGQDNQFKHIINSGVLEDDEVDECDNFFKKFEDNLEKTIIVKYDSEDCILNSRQFKGFTSNGDHFSHIQKLLDVLVFSPIRAIRNNLNQMLYVGTQRVTIDRHFNPEAIQALSWADGMAAWHELMDNVELVNKVNIEIQKVFGSDFYLRLVHLKDVSIDINKLAEKINILTEKKEKITVDMLLRLLSTSGTDIHNRIFFTDKSGVYLSPNDLGHGISQIIPIIVAPLLPTNDANIIAIEEPESNIHPAWQVELAEFFLRVVYQNNNKDNAKNKASENTTSKIYKKSHPFIVLETHSEHIMLRLLRRIRETYENELPQNAQYAYPEDIAVYYIQKDEKGNTQAIQMKITPDGDFSKRWPKGFFEERAEELF